MHLVISSLRINYIRLLTSVQLMLKCFSVVVTEVMAGHQTVTMYSVNAVTAFHVLWRSIPRCKADFTSVTKLLNGISKMWLSNNSLHRRLNFFFLQQSKQKTKSSQGGNERKVWVEVFASGKKVMEKRISPPLFNQSTDCLQSSWPQNNASDILISMWGNGCKAIIGTKNCHLVIYNMLSVKTKKHKWYADVLGC